MFQGEEWELYTEEVTYIVSAVHYECVSKAVCGVSYIENVKNCLYSPNEYIYKALPKA